MKDLKSSQFQYKFKILSLLILSFFQLTGCSSYKTFFAANNHDYKDIQTTKMLSTESKQFPLHTTDRYAIPELANNSTFNKIDDLSPPNYTDHTEADHLPLNNTNSNNKVITKSL